MCVMHCVCVESDGLQYVEVDKYIYHLHIYTYCSFNKTFPVLGQSSNHQNYFYLQNNKMENSFIPFFSVGRLYMHSLGSPGDVKFINNI